MIERKREKFFFFISSLLLIRKQNSDYFIAQQLLASYELSSERKCGCAPEVGERDENILTGSIACACFWKDNPLVFQIQGAKE
jgi:hypothetical protein